METTSFSNPRFTAYPVMVGLHFFIPIACFIIAYVYAQPPAVVPHDGATNRFSAETAFTHLENISQRPRPWGSPEQDRVLDYIRDYAASLKVEVLEVDPPPRAFSPAGPRIRNIAARIPGENSTGAILLMAHHDSKRLASGAGDDGIGVATLLETMRGVVAVKGNRNDIIYLFTDGEEASLLGSRAFIHGNAWDETDEGHPWFKDVKLVLNFDGIGAAGPVMVANTGVRNGWVVKQLAEATRYPIANSLMGEVAKYMPNYSDVIPFEEEGIAVMNFNFADGYPRYHSRLDVPAGVDKRTLQHMGEYALPLAIQFGASDLAALDSRPATYFNPAGHILAYYPAWLAWPLFALTIVAFIAVFVMGLKFGHISFVGVVTGLAAYLIASGVTVAAVYGLARVIDIVQPDTFHFVSAIHLACVTALVFAVYVPIIAFARVWIRAQDITVASLFVWLCVTAAVTVIAPAGNGMFVWPALFAMIGLAFHFGTDDFEQIGSSAGICWALVSGGAVLMYVQGIIALHLAMTPQGVVMMTLPAGFIVLLFGLLTPQISLIVDRHAWVVPSGALLAANGCFIAALVLAGPRAQTAEAQYVAHVERYADPIAVAEETTDGPLSAQEWNSVRYRLAQGERGQALRAIFTIAQGDGTFAEREPAEVLSALTTLADQSLEVDRSIDDYVYLMEETIDFCLFQAEIDESNETAWTARAKAAAYNLGANTWPGWPTPGVELRSVHIAAGAKAADLNLRLAESLRRPADKIAMAHWLVGAHAMANSAWAKALDSFTKAIETQPESDEATKLAYECYSLIAAAGASDNNSESRAKVEESISRLRSISDANGAFYADQLETAARIFLPEHTQGEQREEED